MKDKALAYLQQARGLWSSLSPWKRALLLLVTSGVLVGTILTAVLSSHVSYEYLFTDLSQQDAAGVVAKLNELSIPHKIEAGGSAILVPKERVHEVRLQLAGQGLPRGGGVGFELFDQSQFGATEFEQQVNFRRALEGELSRTIATIDAVRSARVHLVLPERSVFVMREKDGSASVVLNLEHNRQFGGREVKAVVHLVSSAVPGLSPGRVSVVSDEGTTLHRPRNGDADAMGVQDPLVERELETAHALEGRVKALLERVVGANRADVRVRLTLDPRVRERTEEHYNPASTALRSEHHSTEGRTTDEAASGVPGAMSNLPDQEGAGTEEGEEFPEEEDFYDVVDPPSGAVKESWTRNWEIDRVTEKTKIPAGGIQHLSIAVLVDGVYEQVDGQEQFRVRTEEEVDQLTSLVKGAVGVDESRGDIVTVESARFVREAPVDAPVVAPPHPWWPAWFRWYYAAIPTGLLLVLGAAASVMMIRRRVRSASDPQHLALSGTQAADQLETALGQAPSLPEGNLHSIDLEDLRQRAIEFAARDPDTASAILREWLNTTPKAHPSLSPTTVEAEG